MLLLSRLPQIVAVEMFSCRATFVWWCLGMTVVFQAITFAWPPLQPIRNFSLVIALLVLYVWVLNGAIEGSAAWQRWFLTDGGWALAFFATRLPLVLAALAMLPLLHLLGYRRAQYFLVRGNRSAPSGIRLKRKSRKSELCCNTISSIIRISNS